MAITTIFGKDPGSVFGDVPSPANTLLFTGSHEELPTSGSTGDMAYAMAGDEKGAVYKFKEQGLEWEKVEDGGGGSGLPPIERTLTPTLAQQSIEIESDGMGGYYGYISLSLPALIAGDTYVVTWDGTDYTCVAQDRYGSVSLEDANGLVFHITDNWISDFTGDGVTQRTIRITHNGEVWCEGTYPLKEDLETGDVSCVMALNPVQLPNLTYTFTVNGIDYTVTGELISDYGGNAIEWGWSVGNYTFEYRWDADRILASIVGPSAETITFAISSVSQSPPDGYVLGVDDGEWKAVPSGSGSGGGSGLPSTTYYIMVVEPTGDDSADLNFYRPNDEEQISVMGVGVSAERDAETGARSIVFGSVVPNPEADPPITDADIAAMELKIASWRYASYSYSGDFWYSLITGEISAEFYVYPYIL